MQNRALVVIDIQNDITKHYKDIIDNINAATINTRFTGCTGEYLLRMVYA